MYGTSALAALSTVSFFLAAAPSLAQSRVPDDELGDGQDYPFAVGVPEEARKQSTDLFFEGRKLYRESLFALAAEKYRAALAACSCHHPAAHYNLVLSLVNLDRPVEMYENLIASMDNGLELLSKERFEQAKNFKVLLEKQLVAVDLRCDVPGAKVTLDGRTVLNGPGRYRGMERPGLHTVLAVKEGTYPNQVIRQMDGGQKVALNLELRTEEELTVYERRWPAWKPWAVLGAGAVVALAGGGLQYAAYKTGREADNSLRPCANCSPRHDVTLQHDRATALRSLAIVGYSAGGAAIATGAVLAYLNRAKSHRAPYDVDVKPDAVVVVPALDNDSLGLLANCRF
jgi:hypothetical protein